MPFQFREFCNLLATLERLKRHHPPYLPNDLKKKTCDAVVYWFRCNRVSIDSPETDRVALLSTLFPEQRTDRVYGIKEKRLCNLVGRCLRLNSEKKTELKDWKTDGCGDLGDRVERILQPFDGEPKKGGPTHLVTVEEVDAALHLLASGNHFSGPEIYSKTPTFTADQLLGDIYLRLQSSEAKWLTRLILKDFSPVLLDKYLVLSEFHFLLPSLLGFQDCFSAAVKHLKGPLKKYHSKPDFHSQQIFKTEAATLLMPQVGVKVGRPRFLKARSMENCVKLTNQQKWSVERKYDGEYCEVHIDLDQSRDCPIKIFSKSGKDSTEDRKKLHDTLRTCLRIGEPNCAFTKRCIVVGELVVFSDKEQQILEFHHIRKHVLRSGIFLGTEQDSQIRPGEHLMIVLFDLLLVDDNLTLRRPYSERREQLAKMITKRPGYAITSERTIIDFSRPRQAQDALCCQFAAALAYRTEGLLLKPLDMPYFSLEGDENVNMRNYIIKLKKDYLQEFGGERDVADFAVIGASFDPKLVHKSNAGKIQYTTFHLGCLTNKEAALRSGQRPVYEVVGMIGLDQCIPSSELKTLNDHGRFCSRAFARAGNRLKDAVEIGFDVILDQNVCSKMDVVWQDPCVVEVLGSSFEKPSNKSYFMLRHPRILKVHLDRTWREAIDMDQLRVMASEARNAPEIGASQELSQLVKTLMGKFKRKQDHEHFRKSGTSQSDTTASQTTTARPSPSSTKSSPIFRRGRGSSNLKPNSPMLVRMDTAELRPGEKGLLASTEPSIQFASVTTTESLPTPKLFAIESVSGHGEGQKSSQKRSSDEKLNSSPRKRIARCEVTQSKSERTLADISNNNTSRLVYRDNRTPKLAQASRIIHKVDTVGASKVAPSSLTENCHWSNSPFSKAIVYLSPCISNQKWVSDNLLNLHAAERASDLQHWQREIIEVPPLSPLVSESAAWPGMQKVVLVESNRKYPTWALVERIKELRVRDEILFFDWRILEDWMSVEDRGNEEIDSQRFVESAQKRLYGMTTWVPENDCVVFVNKDVAVIPRSWLLQ